MKLQGPVRTQQQSLGRHNVNVTAEAGKVAGIRTATQGVTSGLNQLARASDEINQINSQRQSQQSGLFAQKTESDFWNQWGGKEFFDVSELPEEVITEGMQVKGRIASAEVLPLMYKNHMEAALPEASKIIENENVRKNWLTTANESLLARHTKIQTKANSNIERQIFEDQKINYTNAIEQRRPDVALQIANDMNGSPTEVTEFKRKARETSETIVYEDQIITQDVDGMTKSVEHLRQEHDAYIKKNGQLDDTMRMAWISKLENQLGNIARTNSSIDKSQIESLKREISVTTSSSNKGKAVDPIIFADLVKRADDANIKNDGNLTAEIETLKLAAAFADLVNRQNKGNRDERLAFINKVSQDSGAKSFEVDKMVLDLQTANDVQTRAENSDMLKSAVDSEAVSSLVPVSVEGGNPQQIAEQLVVRKEQHDALEARYGVSQGYLTKDEVEKLSSQYNTKNPTEQLKFLKATSATLGKDAINLYGQMETNGGGTMAIAGNIVLNGNESQAQVLLRGAEFRRESGENVKVLKDSVYLELESSLGRAYWNNASYNKNVHSAVLDTYIGYVLQEGGSKDDLITVDSDLYDKAINAVTGGMLDWNGSVTPAPEYGMKQDQFETWIETISPKEIELNGGIAGPDGANFINRFKDEEFSLEEYGSQGNYVIRRDDGTYIQNREGNIFNLKYRSDYDRITPTKRKVDVTKIAPGL